MNQAIRSCSLSLTSIYMNHSAVCPLSTSPRRNERAVEDVTNNGSVNYADWFRHTKTLAHRRLDW
jgi:hypothetical protein